MNIKDLAKLSGVAPSTVSKVINNYKGVSEQTKKKVLDAIKKYNYTSNMNARILSMKKSNFIGVLMPKRSSFGLDSPFQSVILEGFRKSISNLGYDTVFISTNIFGQKVRYIDHCKYMNLAGVLLLAYDDSDDEVLEVINSDIPVVSTNFRSNTSVCEIYSDDIKGSTLATEYLISLGHRSIGYIYGPLNNSNSAVVRLKAFKDTMIKHGLEIDPKYIKNTDEYTFDHGYDIMEEIIQSEGILPTAFAVGSDLLAYGVMKALKKNGYKIPEDISVIGFDDLESSRYSEPALTTINQDLNMIGEAAANTLIDLIENRTSKENIILPTELVIRESCKYNSGQGEL